MKETWLKGSKQVCGMTKGPPRHKETWWLNRDVEKVVATRNVCHKAWRKSKLAEDKHTLDVAKKEVYTAVMTAQESKLQEFTADLQSESGRKNCFRIARLPPARGGNRPEEDPSSGKLESTHPSRTSVKYDQVFFGVESIMRVNAASLDIRDATTSTPGTLNDLTTDLIMANNNNNRWLGREVMSSACAV